MNIKECFQHLEISASATDSEIRQAYKRLVKSWHPDRFEADSSLKAYAEERLKIINAAYDQILRYRDFLDKVGPTPPQMSPEPSSPTPPDKKAINLKDLLSILSKLINQIFSVFQHSSDIDDALSNASPHGLNQRHTVKRPFQSVLKELREGKPLFDNRQKRKINYNINMIFQLRQRYGPRRKGGGAVTGIASTDNVQAVKWVRNVSPVRRVK